MANSVSRTRSSSFELRAATVFTLLPLTAMHSSTLRSRLLTTAALCFWSTAAFCCSAAMSAPTRFIARFSSWISSSDFLGGKHTSTTSYMVSST
jgi:hypothetical protein